MCDTGGSSAPAPDPQIGAAAAANAATAKAIADAKNTNLSKFLVNVESRIYAQLSKQLAEFFYLCMLFLMKINYLKICGSILKSSCLKFTDCCKCLNLNLLNPN